MRDESLNSKAPKQPGSYRDLIGWQRKSMTLAKLVHRLTKSLPSEERYGPTSQKRRAAVSIPSSIAEEQARRGTHEFIQFIAQAEGSLAKLDAQRALATDLGYAAPSQT